MNNLRDKFTSDFAKKIYQDGALLKYQTSGSSGFDIRAVGLSILNNDNTILNRLINEDEIIIIKPNERICVQVGFSVSLSDQYEIQIRPRSGLAFKNGITIVNTPGTIDSDYRGEVGVIILNTSNKNFEIKPGDRIAQAVICPVIKLDFIFTDNLDPTDRSDGRFGSTGCN